MKALTKKPRPLSTSANGWARHLAKEIHRQLLKRGAKLYRIDYKTFLCDDSAVVDIGDHSQFRAYLIAKEYIHSEYTRTRCLIQYLTILVQANSEVLALDTNQGNQLIWYTDRSEEARIHSALTDLLHSNLPRKVSESIAPVEEQ